MTTIHRELEAEMHRDAFTLTTACVIPYPLRASSAEGRRANTAAETAAELAAFDHGLRIYTDGGCDTNGAGGMLGASGWGAHALQVGLDGDCLTTIAIAQQRQRLPVVGSQPTRTMPPMKSLLAGWQTLQ